ncbi:MAG: restriction endonuclease subunit S [Dialister hominis]|uniref:restriction endonuclease subunit S n=1 Tax=Dialister hominis TaxID=2582419 RepID=UPI00300EF84F
METMKIKLSEVIDDIAAGPFGSNLKVSCFVDYGFPIIDGANLKGYKVTDNITKFVTEEKARSLHRSIAKRGDVVVTISGTLGQIAYIPTDSKFKEYLCSQRQFRATFNPERVYPPYLVFYFHTWEGKHKILSFANQTGVPALSQPLKNFKNIIIELPSIEVQKKIASFCEMLNDKIEQNNKINKNLSEQLQALYTSEFDVTIHHATAKLSDICHYSVEKVNVDELSTKTYYSTENMQPNKVSSVEATNLPNIKQTTRCHKGDVLVSNIRPYFKKIEYVTTECGCSTDVLCFVPASKELSAFLYETLYADRFFDYMVAGSKGTKMPRGDKQQIMQYEVVMPSSEQLLAFNAAATPMLALITNGLLENERLSMLRDSLLPRLMAGELDVSDIDF